MLKFSKPFKVHGTWKDGVKKEGNKIEEGPSVGGYIEFAAGTDLVEIRIGSSFIDYAQAQANLKQEMPIRASFGETKRKVKEVWSENLNKIAIKGASKDDLDIFHTAFFRTMQYPRKFSEYGRYYSAFDDKVHNGHSYNAYSLWDTFRAQHPW